MAIGSETGSKSAKWRHNIARGRAPGPCRMTSGKRDILNLDARIIGRKQRRKVEIVVYENYWVVLGF